MAKRAKLQKFIYISIGTAIATIGLKTVAFLATNSVGLLSDALESLVNLVAGVVALVIFRYSTKPADKNHNFGHHKAEYFSSIIESGLILMAGGMIIWTAVERLITPTAITNLDLGVLVGVLASGLNLITARILISQGSKHRSILLEADGHHLMSDVWTSLGVLVGVTLARLSGLVFIDPLIAIAVALHIIKTGVRLIMRSANGLLDPAIDADDLKTVRQYLRQLKDQGLDYHKLQTRQTGDYKLIVFHLLVPDDWTVKQAHQRAHQIEADIRQLLGKNTEVASHVEPLSDLE